MNVLKMVIAFGAIALTLVAMTALIIREGTGLVHLGFCGGIGGAAAGFVWRGRRGLGLGLLFGTAVGLAFPCLYAPFWIAFTLPPHPEVDL